MNNLDIIKNYHQRLWDEKDLTAIDEFFSSNAKVRSPVQPADSLAEIKETMATWLTAFPDLKVYWDDYICDENKVVARWHAEGTHLGQFQELPATKNKIDYIGITIYELSDGKIVNYWAIADMLGILYQLQ